MARLLQPSIPALLFALLASPLHAQQPFYTDDPAVTERGTWHLEFFDEFDAFHHAQFPSLRQNTANYKLNYGLPGNLEIDLDSPYLSIFRGLSRSQIQILAGGKYALRNGLTLDFGLLGGKFIASPRIGGQIGFSVDFPAVLR